MTQLSLLRTRRFAAFFWTQFLGAFNDNLLQERAGDPDRLPALTVLGLAPRAAGRAVRRASSSCRSSCSRRPPASSPTASASHRLVRCGEGGRDRDHGDRRARLLGASDLWLLLAALFLMGCTRASSVRSSTASCRSCCTRTSWSAATRWSRWAPSSRSCSARSAAASVVARGAAGRSLIAGGAARGRGRRASSSSFLVPRDARPRTRRCASQLNPLRPTARDLRI